MAETAYPYLECTTNQDVLVLTFTQADLRGDLNAGGDTVAKNLRQAFTDILNDKKPTKVVLDFQQVTMLASPVLRPLLFLRGKLKETGGQLRACNLTSNVKDVLLTTKTLEEPLQIQPDVAAAVASLSR